MRFRRVRAGVVGSTAVAVFLGVAALSTAPNAAPPDRGDKRVVIDCKPGWRGSAAGAYGGVSFGVSCINGRGQTNLTGTVGTAYSIRMGVESSSIAVDCFFTGDAPVVNESCASVRISVR